jgi:hypothetical protein
MHVFRIVILSEAKDLLFCQRRRPASHLNARPYLPFSQSQPRPPPDPDCGIEIRPTVIMATHGGRSSFAVESVFFLVYYNKHPHPRMDTALPPRQSLR